MASNDLLRIQVRPQFQRSIQLDNDLMRPDALAGYICQASPRNALSVVARHINESQQRAFTWTGPYGGGKSTLALALGQLAGGSPAMRQNAKRALRVENPDDEIWTAFGSKKPWLVLPVVGRRQTVEEAIGQTIDKHASQRGPKPVRAGRRDVVGELVRRAESGEYGGVLLVMDELGKLFEAAAAAGEDIYVFQELAEAASRAKGRLVVIGVLHQAFEQYASRSGRDTQAEWAKVQGRYVDIPIVAGIDEVIELIGGAIDCEESHPDSLAVASRIADAIRQRRPGSPANLAESLDRCWPLHPVTAALLGPSSRRRFGQNERSVFGFLNSAEPLGLREFLSGQSRRSPEYYEPARFWEYLRVNFEPAILASADGHRWAVSAEAIERVEARFQEPHVALVKTIAAIELFRNGSGLTASNDVLQQCVRRYSKQELEAALDDLAAASILIYRKHLQAWAVYAGSDFDIDAAVDTAKREGALGLEEQLTRLAVLPPVTARKHYSETGTLRWFERVVTTADNAVTIVAKKRVDSCSGRFILLVPGTDTSDVDIDRLARDLAKRSPDSLDLFGVPKGSHRLAELAIELAALEHVAEFNTKLEGDSIARRELTARLEQLRGDLEGALREAFSNATWYALGKRFNCRPEDGLSPIASQICDLVFPQAPQIFSELVNRDGLSSNAAKAQRLLMHRMLSHAAQPDLGYSGYPADAGLYFTTLAALGLHRTTAGQGRFMSPERARNSAGAESLVPLWRQFRERLESANQSVTLAELYDLARRPPFGLKCGVLPLIALAFLLVHRSEIALYVEGVFTPDLSDADVDEWLQDPSRVAMKWVRMDATAKQLLTKLAARLESAVQRPVAPDPLDSARALVSLALALPAWTQRTASVSKRAIETRTLLLRASDPIKVIFADLPEVLGTGRDVDALVTEVGSIVEELSAAYPKVLQRIADQMLASIDHQGSMKSLQARARVVQGISGDFKLDAFATRLTTFAGSPSDIESLVSLAVNKPPREFSDHDIDLATVQLARWSFEFRRMEAVASVQGRPANRRALAVVFAGQETRSVTVDVAEDDSQAIREIRDNLLDRMRSSSVKPDVFLAALAEVGAAMVEAMREEVAEHD